jgi:tetratricopeptide (TPR) repeat protein
MDRITTKTLAEIYLQQGHLQEAYKIFKSLSEKDPSNMEIQRRLKELREKLKHPSLLTDLSIRTPEENIRLLERWLANIRERKRG